ncbi:MAG: hypothetical protein AABY18_08865 [Candidatus Thermoplasmatota archaeon]
MNLRAAIAVVVLVLLAGGLWWIASLAPDPERPDGRFDVYVVGPTTVLANGTVTLSDADALRVLLALSEQRGFDVNVDDFDGCAYDYVRGIAGHTESATGGWNYYFRRGGGEWEWQAQAASCAGLESGEDLLWCWVEADERCAVYP